jgi:hypothetical protein
MNTFKEGDKVIYTDTNDTEWDAVVKRIEAINGKDVVVISMNGGWPIYVRIDQVRPTQRTARVIANDIVRKYKKIETLRQEINNLYGDIEELLEEDGQPSWEHRLVADMRTVQRNVLRYETANQITQWEGYRDNR